MLDGKGASANSFTGACGNSSHDPFMESGASLGVTSAGVSGGGGGRGDGVGLGIGKILGGRIGFKISPIFSKTPPPEGVEGVEGGVGFCWTDGVEGLEGTEGFDGTETGADTGL